MLNRIYIVGKADKSKIKKECDRLSKLKSIPDGTYELIYQLDEREGQATSYCNNRLMWLGWKLEEAGISVKWSSCC